MGNLFQKHPGAKQPTSAEYNRLVSLARSGTRLSGGRGTNTYAAEEGQTSSPAPQSRFKDSSLVAVRNDGPGQPPLYGIGQIYASVASNPSTPPILCARQPICAGFSNLCIFMESAPPQGSSPFAVVSGLAVVGYQYPGRSLACGERLGCAANSWLAQVDALGPMLVQEDYGLVGTGPSAGYYSAVKLTGERGDMKFLIDCNGNATVARTIVWGLPYSLSDQNPAAPGVPSISKIGSA